jgi:integrase
MRKISPQNTGKATTDSATESGTLALPDTTECVTVAVTIQTSPQVVLSRFSAVADGYIAAAVAESTKRIYAVDAKHFAANGITVPATPAQVLEYLGKHAGQLAVSTLERRLNFLNKAHRDEQFPSPTVDLDVRLAMRGIRRTFSVRKKQARALVRDDILEALLLIGKQKPLKAARDRALLLVGWAGGFRRSELTGICVEHVTMVDTGMEVFLPHSKVDQNQQGRTVFIPFGSTESRCPVRALINWLEVAQIKTGFAFRSVSRHDHVGSSGLTPQSVTLVVRDAIEKTGADVSRVSAHGLRAGFVTQACMDGMPAHDIRQTTGHKSQSMIDLYTRPVQRRRIRSLL